ncbi:MAG: metallophosphoesterase [Clostridia bacterium]|nr:metallophosphoesterase [Clostridia bacterium]
MKIFKNKVAIISDLHLGVHQSNSVWHDISINFAHWLKQTLNDNDIKDIIILGDVLDNRNEVSVITLHVMVKFFKILEDFNIIITTGNHDCYYTKRSDVHSIGTLNDWENIEIIDKPLTVNLFNKNLSFCPWNTQLNEIPNSDIIFGHFEINSFKMNGGYLCENGFESNSLLDKAPLILSGHFHCTEERNYKKGKIIYIGSPYEQSWGESGDPKGIYLLNLHDNSLEFVDNPISPKHKKIRISELLAIGKITDHIKNEFKGNIITFIIDTELEQKNIDNLISKLYALKPLSLKIENLLHEQKILSIEEEIEFDGIDIKQNIIDFIKKFENMEDKQKHIEYLSEVYEKCKEIKK